ncbi:MAG: restriction endonuclease subunit S [Spirosomataceae bacterium]|jgi:type I restriction enzyme S subunit
MKDWKIVTWKEVLEIKNGKNQKKVQNEAGIYPIYGSGGVMGYSNDFLCPEGTTIIGRKGSINNPIYVNEKFWNVDTAFGLIPSQKLDNKYLYYFCTTYNFLKHNKATTLPSLTKLDLLKIQIPLPPLEEQKRIAAILDAADLHRQKTKALLDKYDELAQALFLDMFGDPVTNPKGWEKMEIQNITSVSSGSTPSRELPENYMGDIPWVKTGEVNGKEIIDTEEKISQTALENSSCKVYPKGSILIAMYGQGKTRGQVGYLGIPASTNQACAVLKYSEKVNFVFLYYLLKLCYEDLRSLGRGGNQPNLNSGLIKKYLVINPPIEIQEAFSKKIKIIESQISQAEQSLQKAEELFQSLLQKAFKGEL